MVYPLGSTRPPCPKEVPDAISKDYNQACLIESLSPEASAALARRWELNNHGRSGRSAVQFVRTVAAHIDDDLKLD